MDRDLGRAGQALFFKLHNPFSMRVFQRIAGDQGSVDFSGIETFSNASAYSLCSARQKHWTHIDKVGVFHSLLSVSGRYGSILDRSRCVAHCSTTTLLTIGLIEDVG